LPNGSADLRKHTGERELNRADLIALASPPCHECGESVQHVETRWQRDEESNWRLGPCFMVCGEGHRVLVEPLP
jgi:hypothetical protein